MNREAKRAMKQTKQDKQKKLLRIGCLVLAGVLVLSIVSSLILPFMV